MLLVVVAVPNLADKAEPDTAPPYHQNVTTSSKKTNQLKVSWLCLPDFYGELSSNLCSAFLDPPRQHSHPTPTPKTVQHLASTTPHLYSLPYKEVFGVKTMSYSESRARYAEVLQSVVDDREEIIITRSGHESAVIMSLDDYNSLRETAYLMRSPKNARRLFDAVDRLEAGEGTVHGLIED